MDGRIGVTVRVYVQAEGDDSPRILDLWIAGGIGTGASSGPEPEPADWRQGGKMLRYQVRPLVKKENRHG